MRSLIYLPVALLPLALFLVNPGGAGTGSYLGNHAGSTTESPELEYLKAVNSVAPPKDPQLLWRHVEAPRLARRFPHPNGGDP
jgi:hypothetical protein